MSSVKNKNFTSSFLFRMSFISLSHLVVLARTSTTILNQCGSGHPYFVSYQRKSFQVFTVEYNVSFGFVIYVLYYTEVFSFYTLYVEGFVMKECHTLSNVFWKSIEIIKLFYNSFYLSLKPRDKSHLVLVYNSFNVFLNLAC